MDEAIKYDKDKIKMELLPPELMTAVGTILTFGAQKYSERNWEKGMDWGRVYGAMLRHLNAWWSGEDNDPETGESHLWHAACCVTFLITYEQRGVGNDTRPTEMKGEGEWKKNYVVTGADIGWPPSEQAMPGSVTPVEQWPY